MVGLNTCGFVVTSLTKTHKITDITVSFMCKQPDPDLQTDYVHELAYPAATPSVGHMWQTCRQALAAWLGAVSDTHGAELALQQHSLLYVIEQDDCKVLYGCTLFALNSVWPNRPASDHSCTCRAAFMQMTLFLFVLGCRLLTASLLCQWPGMPVLHQGRLAL